MNALRVNVIMPVAVIAVISVVLIAIAAFVLLPNWERPFVKWFAGAVFLLVGGVAIAVVMHVRNNLGDLRDGVAQVRSGRLTHKRQTGRSPYTFYATIDGIGELIVWGTDYAQMSENNTYIVAFSPRTRRVWTVSSAS